MKRPVYNIFIASIFLILLAGNRGYAEKPASEYDGIYGNGSISFTIATGSPGSLGLLKELAVPFCKNYNCTVRWVKRGSGASLKALKTG